MEYSKGFETFWKAWLTITRTPHDKKPSYRYWKRDKLEGKEEKIITILKKQEDGRVSDRIKGKFVPQWCYCQRWLHEARYEYVPDLAPQNEAQPKPKPVIITATPEQRAVIKRQAGILAHKIEYKPGKLEDKKQEQIRRLKNGKHD